jgi:acetoin utilization deacetylase AcuC-like enzyme
VALEIPVVWSDRCLLHEPGGEVWIGLPVQGDEIPARVVTIRDALLEAGAPLIEAEEHGEEPIRAVHDDGLIEFLRGAWEHWQAAGYAEDPGQHSVVAYIFPHPGLLSFSTAPPQPMPARDLPATM